MLFNSFGFIFLFLPITVGGFALLNRTMRYRAASAWLLAASLFFYGYWNPRYLLLIAVSVVVNFLIGNQFIQKNAPPLGSRKRRVLLVLGLAFNLGLLGYFKYVDFFITNLSALTGASLALHRVALPLAISFFSLQQIKFIVDAYEEVITETDFLHYALFVTLFPHLIAGPIVHHQTLVRQFANDDLRKFRIRNLTTGIFIFSIGLAKKVLLADNLSRAAAEGFGNPAALSLPEAWLASLSYTFQLYFDFSGYADMAIGAAVMLGFELPINFASPYKARGMIEFWQRWHITLSNFITGYLYTPMMRASKQVTFVRALAVTLLTMLIAGLWHGAAWTFVIFGGLHGLGLVVNQIWRKKIKLKVPAVLGWLTTFLFVNMTFVFFRAKSASDALAILRAMLGLSGVTLPLSLEGRLGALRRFGVHFGALPIATDTLFRGALLVALSLAIVLLARNTQQLRERFEPRWTSSLAVAAVFVMSVMNLSEITEFLYFNF